MNDKQVQLIIERLKERIQKANELFLTNIGENIKKLKKLKPSDAQKLIQILKYGGNYEEMIKKIAKYTQMNVEDVDKIFSTFAKKDMEFNKQFYDYRNIPFEEYSKNMPLQRQTEAITNMVKNEVYNFSRTNVLGYTIKDNEGNEIFKGLRETYNDLLDTAFLNVGQGKETFDQAMRSVLKDIGQSGLKTLDYESGRSIRLDSAITMHLRSRLTELHNENQKLIGEQYDADGIEISVHLNPAPDHEEAQGHQFYLDEYEKLQSDGVAKDVDGKEIDLHRTLKDGDSADTFRPIGEYNCYHYEFRIIVGVNKPSYSEEQLQKIIEDNENGFEYEGKHYTNYQGEQLQRKLETAIREQKDIQILGRTSGDKTMIDDADKKIKVLTNKYNELSKVSGLKVKKDRLSVSGYRSSIRQGNSKTDIGVDLNYNVLDNKEMPKLKDNEVFISKEEQIQRLQYRKEAINEQIIKVQNQLNEIPKDSTKNWDISMRKIYENDLRKYKTKLKEIDIENVKDEILSLDTKEDCIEFFDRMNIKLKNQNLDKVDVEVLRDNAIRYNETLRKYPFLNQTFQERELVLKYGKTSSPGTIGEATRTGYDITMNIEDFNNKDDVIYWAKYQTSIKEHYNMPCAKEYYTSYFQMHELGHTFNYRIIKNIDWSTMEDMGISELYDYTNKKFVNDIFEIARKNTGKTKKELLDMLSLYGKKNDEETLAELFANANCGKPNDLGKAFDEYFKELLK